VCDAKFLNIEKQNFFLTHYPCLTSNFDENKPLNRRTINICGHAHTKDKFLDFNKGLIYHVECDAHNCYPILLENILTDIRKELNK
jgi:calcineurin-like phosphoesterase family protein